MNSELIRRLKRLERRLKCCLTRFEDTYEEFPETGQDNILYIDRASGKIYIWDGSGYKQTSDDDTSDHASLSNLDYASSGHTGFATAAQGNKADSALQSETDPTVPSHVKSITSQDIDNWNESYEPTWQVLTDAPTITWNVDLGIMAEVTLGGNRTLANPTNLRKGTYSLLVKQDATGGRTLALGTSYKTPNQVPLVLSTAANAVDLLTFVSDGTTLYLAMVKNY